MSLLLKTPFEGAVPCTVGDLKFKKKTQFVGAAIRLKDKKQHIFCRMERSQTDLQCECIFGNRPTADTHIRYCIVQFFDF